MPALAPRRLDGSQETRDGIINELRKTKLMALRLKDMKAVKYSNKALEKLGATDNPEIAQEIDLEVELDCIRTALYRHFDKDGNLLYVGVSLNAIERTIAHRDKSHWYNDIARIEIEWHHSRSAAYYQEKLVIKREHPKHNIRDNA